MRPLTTLAALLIFQAILTPKKAQAQYNYQPTPGQAPQMPTPPEELATWRPAYTKGRHFFSAGYGVGNIALIAFRYGSNLKADIFNQNNYQVQRNYSSIGPLHAKYEYAITNRLGLGISANYVRATIHATYTEYSGGMPAGNSYTTTFIWQGLSVLLRANYHYLDDLHWDIYTGAGLGARTNRYSARDDSRSGYTYAFNVSAFPIGFELTQGVRYMPLRNLGLYTELGFGKSILQGGMVLGI